MEPEVVLGGGLDLLGDQSAALSVLRALPEASVLVFDTALRYVFVGGEALGRHGVSPAQLEQQRRADVLAPERWALYEPMYRAALAGETSSIEVEAVSHARRYLVDVGPLRSGSGEVAGGVVIAREVTGRRAAEKQLERSRRLLQDVLDGLTTGVSVKDRERRFVLVNTAYERSQRFSREEVVGKTVSDLYPADAAERCDADDLLTLETGRANSAEYEVRQPDGSVRTFLIGRSPLRDREGSVYGLCAVATDISERTQTEQALQEARQLFEQVLEHAPIGMALVGLDGHWTRINKALCQMMGYPRDDLIRKTFEDITHPDDLTAGRELHRRLAGGEIDNYETEKRYVNARGQTIWARLSVSLVRTADNEPQYVIAQIQDITDHKLMEKKLRHLADHDSLTGLPNRRFFEERLAIAVGRCQRYGDNATLLLIDLDDFKKVNDAHGHRSGDDVLKAVANAIRGQIRASDTPARIGGDEFAVLLQAAGSEGAAVAEAIRQAIADTIVEVRHGEIGLTASIGTAVLHERTPDSEAALTEADAAMYLDKTSVHRGSRATVRRDPDAQGRVNRSSLEPSRLAM